MRSAVVIVHELSRLDPLCSTLQELDFLLAFVATKEPPKSPVIRRILRSSRSCIGSDARSFLQVSYARWAQVKGIILKRNGRPESYMLVF